MEIEIGGFDLDGEGMMIPESSATHAGLPSTVPGKDSLLFDKDICTSLGMTMETGMCLRHPNICIYETGNTTTTESTVHSCRICDSETRAGGIRQRKSFALAIHQIQQIHGTPEWDQFKDAWGAEDTIEQVGGGGVCLMKSEDEKKEIGVDGSITFVANKEQAQDSIDTRNVRPSAIMRSSGMPRLKWTRQVLKRAAQVAAWQTAHQAAEMELLQKEMGLLKHELAKAQESAAKRELDLKSIVQKQATEVEALQAKCEKQEKHIQKDLRMIKSIAMKRANSKLSMGENSASTTNNGNNNNNTKDATPVSPAGKSSTSAATAKSHEVPLKQASRQQSAGIHEIQSPTVTAATSDTTGSMDMPTRPMSGRDQQFSSLTLTDVSAFHAKNNPLGRNNPSDDYFDQDRSPPNQPQRLPSHDTGITTMSDLSSSMYASGGENSIVFTPGGNDFKQLDIHNTTPSSVLTGSSRKKYASKMNPNGENISFIQEEEEEEEGDDESDEAAPEERKDRLPADIMDSPGQQRERRKDVVGRQRGGGGASRGRRAKTELVGNVTAKRTPQPANRSASVGDHEISFFPTESEAANSSDAVPPPPALSPVQSHEIEFDASHDIVTEGVDGRRKSLMGMKFDSTSQRLLMEASAAMADPTVNPLNMTPSATQRKTAKSPAVAANNRKQQSQRLSLLSSQAHNHRDIDLANNSMAALTGTLNNTSFHNKTEEEILNEKIFGKVEKATPENEMDDEYDYFEDLPSDLGLSKDGYLQVRSSCNLSPVSAITTGSLSYLMDHGSGGLDLEDDDEDDDGPRKGLHQAGFAKRLPMEEDFDSDDNDDDDDDGADDDDADQVSGKGATNGMAVSASAAVGKMEDNNSHDGDLQQPPVELISSPVGSQGKMSSPPITQIKSAHPDQRHRKQQAQQQLQHLQQQQQQNSMIKPKAQKIPDQQQQQQQQQVLVTPATLRSLSAGFNKDGTAGGHHPPGARGGPKSHHSRVPTATLYVENEVVQDKYGDGGIYTGTIASEDRLPHGNGKMAYDNERQYDGEWRKGRWHGIGKWVNPNGDCYEGTFVYDARHGRGTYTWQNGNVYKGDFHEDKRQGKGVFNFANGNVYQGDFINGVFEGQGRYSFEGGFYEGGWRGGRYHNHGYLRFADGSSYTGEFVDGVAHGQGEEKAADGTVRAGYWENGRPIPT